MKTKLLNFIFIALLLLLVSGNALHADVTTTYFVQDALGSPVAAMDESGNTLWVKQYHPYGREHDADPASFSNRVSFTGHAYDRELGLDYMGARYYDPIIGRFMGIDPIGFDEANPMSFNRYSYANNNPYVYVDPNGEAVETISDVISLGLSLDAFNSDPSFINGLGLTYDALATVIPFAPAGFGIIKNASIVTKSAGRSGKQARLRELANDPKLGKADRGWIKQEQNSIARGNRKTIRNPPGKDLAHERGREAAKGYGYKYSNLQDRKLHRTQHKYDNFGRNNKERPPQ